MATLRSKFDALNIPNVPINLKQTATARYDYISNRNEAFKSVAIPTLQHYLTLYLALAKEELGPPLVHNIIAIANQLKKPGTDNQIITMKEDNNKTLVITPSTSDSVPSIWDIGSINTWLTNNEIMGEKSTITTETEESFKIYMQAISVLLLRLVFKESNNIGDKFGNIFQGYRLLGEELGVNKTYLCVSATGTFITSLRSALLNHTCRKPLANSIITSYLHYESDSHVVSFLNWTLMTATKYIHTNTAKYVFMAMSAASLSLRNYLEIIYDDKTEAEIDILVVYLAKLLKPTLSVNDAGYTESYKEWVYYVWSGLFDDNYFYEIRTYLMPRVMSVCMGAIEASEGSSISLPSFKVTMIYTAYLALGKSLISSKVNDMLGTNCLVPNRMQAPTTNDVDNILKEALES